MSDEVRKDTYPPVGHIIRHLGLDIVLTSPGELQCTMPIPDDVRDPGGALRFGAMATMIDVVAGTYSHEIVRPDWLATTDMKIHAVRPAMGDEVHSVTTTVRASKRNILSLTVVSDTKGEVARSWVTYARLPRRGDSPAVEETSRVGRHLHYVEPEHIEPPGVPRALLDDYVGFRVDPESLAINVDHEPQIHNSFGSIQGGVASMLVERVATVAGDRHFERPTRVTDLHVHFLGQTRAGPIRAEGSVIRADAASVTCEAAVVDAGNDDLLLDLGTATAVPV